MPTYQIAGLKVRYHPLYPMLASRSEKYRVEDDPQTPQLILRPEWVAQEQEHYPHLDEATVEYMLTTHAYYRLLLRHGGMMLHASAVVVDNAAYLFSAPSGTGKSTHTSLWLREFGPRAYILNDDKPAIRVQPDGVFAYGTPFSGKYDISENKRVPLQGIAFIKRSETNAIERKDNKDALYALLNQTVRPQELSLYQNLLQVVQQLLEKTPVYTLRCNMDSQAAHVSYQAMKEGK